MSIFSFYGDVIYSSSGTISFKVCVSPKAVAIVSFGDPLSRGLTRKKGCSLLLHLLYTSPAALLPACELVDWDSTRSLEGVVGEDVVLSRYCMCSTYVLCALSTSPLLSV